MEAVLDRLDAKVDPQRRVTLGTLIAAVGERGFGPVFLALSLLIISPIGGVPALPTITAAILAVTAVQMLIGRRQLRLPEVFTRKSLRGDHLSRGIAWIRPAARWMDRRFGRRLIALTSDTARRVAALAIIALCLVVPPLEMVPFAAILPMSAIALFGIALTVRDGIVMLAAFALAGAGLIGAPVLLLSG
ncbi:exopolysaccharide biosynthesis protein [Roseivivax sediminis]|uniref:Uncharacterized conserved protein n=1 Tax=Roseivivax sediminis TaxID=936889 RepID=A0A1I1U615_9RHOB|nr:exopolysaccharide biosynthesis protein [Roseivivax sediminis]SFD66282.1 Uncharacterized conserved protein [Roseivivax sediminis]